MPLELTGKRVDDGRVAEKRKREMKLKVELATRVKFNIDMNLSA